MSPVQPFESMLEKIAEMQSKSNMSVIETMLEKLYTPKDSNPSVNPKPMIQLSKLDPPTWDGDPRNYYDFKNRFIATMSRSNILDEYVKMTYLVKSIKHQKYLDRVKNCQDLDAVWKAIETHN